MSFMKKMGFETTDLNDFTSKKKKFVITFDDGYEDVYENALPILKKYNFQAICFFVTNSFKFLLLYSFFVNEKYFGVKILLLVKRSFEIILFIALYELTTPEWV